MAENEGVGETGEAIVMCTSPDVCLTSGAPVPYQIIARFDSVIRQEATVRFKGNKVMTMDSRITNVIGDEAGTGGGIISGVNLGYCRPITHSTTVRAGGNHVIYHSALYWMNCAGPEGPGNTIGAVVYVESVDCVYVGPLGEVVGDTNPPVAPEKKELSALDQVGGFFQGFWDAGVETVKGIGGMAVGAWKLTGGWIFDSKASMETWSHLTTTASVVWNHPEAVWDAIKEPYAEAWSRGEYGKAFGRGAFEVVALVATTKGADKLSKAAKLKKAGEVADVAGKAGKVEEALVDVAKVESKVAGAEEVIGQVAKDGAKVTRATAAEPAAQVFATLPKSLFEPLNCTGAAKAMSKALKARGIPHERVAFQARGEFMVNDLVGRGKASITKNGYHEAVRVGNMVYDNFLPQGVPWDTYFKALHADGGVVQVAPKP